MTARRLFPYIAVALPALILAAIGLTHPIHLTAQVAEYWRNVHIVTLPIFACLGFAPWLIVRGHDAFVSWIAGILGFVYAAFYGSLDVLAGIGAGGLKLDGMGMATGIGVLYDLARSLGFIGSVALIAACAIAALDAFKRAGSLTLLGSAVAIVGSFLFLQNHIFPPLGVIGQVFLAVGWVTTLVLLDRAGATKATAPVSTATPKVGR